MYPVKQIDMDFCNVCTLTCFTGFYSGYSAAVHKEYIYICSQLPRATPFQLTVSLKTRQKTTKKACQALRQGQSGSLSGFRSSREGTFPKKTQTHHQSKIFLARNPLHCSGNPASLQQNTQSHWQPEGVSETTARHARGTILPCGTWGKAKTATAPFLGLRILAGPL